MKISISNGDEEQDGDDDIEGMFDHMLAEGYMGG